MRAVFRLVKGDWSNIYEVTTASIKDKAFAKASVVTTNMFVLQWRDTPGAFDYQVSINGGEYISTHLSTYLLQFGLNANTNYKYTVRAVDQNGKVLETYSDTILTLSE